MCICEYTKCTHAHISTRLLNQRMCRRVLCRRVSFEMDTCTYVPFEYTHVHSFMLYQVVFWLAYTLRCLSRHEVLSFKNRLKMPYLCDIAFLLSHAFIRNDDTSLHIFFIGNLNFVSLSIIINSIRFWPATVYSSSRKWQYTSYSQRKCLSSSTSPFLHIS